MNREASEANEDSEDSKVRNEVLTAFSGACIALASECNHQTSLLLQKLESWKVGSLFHVGNGVKGQVLRASSLPASAGGE